MMKPTPCKWKRFTDSGYSGTSEALNVRARLLGWQISTDDNTELNGQYVSFRDKGSSGGIVLKWEFGISTAGLGGANLIVYNCTIPGGGILFPNGIYVDFSALTEDSWSVTMLYQS